MEFRLSQYRRQPFLLTNFFLLFIVVLLSDARQSPIATPVFKNAATKNDDGPIREDVLLPVKGSTLGIPTATKNILAAKTPYGPPFPLPNRGGEGGGGGGGQASQKDLLGSQKDLLGSQSDLLGSQKGLLGSQISKQESLNSPPHQELFLAGQRRPILSSGEQLLSSDNKAKGFLRRRIQQTNAVSRSSSSVNTPPPAESSASKCPEQQVIDPDDAEVKYYYDKYNDDDDNDEEETDVDTGDLVFGSGQDYERFREWQQQRKRKVAQQQHELGWASQGRSGRAASAAGRADGSAAGRADGSAAGRADGSAAGRADGPANDDDDGGAGDTTPPLRYPAVHPLKPGRHSLLWKFQFASITAALAVMYGIELLIDLKRRRDFTLFSRPSTCLMLGANFRGLGETRLVAVARCFTCIFLHAHIFHLLTNGLSLFAAWNYFMMGPGMHAENVWVYHWTFPTFVITAFFGSVYSYQTTLKQTGFSIGASGGCLGVSSTFILISIQLEGVPSYRTMHLLVSVASILASCIPWGLLCKLGE